MPSLGERIQRFAALPSDSEDARLQKSIVLVVALAGCLIAGLEAVASVLVGLHRIAAAQAGFALAMLVGLIGFGWQKDFLALVRNMCVVVLIGPFAIAWMIGGIRDGGPATIWAAAAPLGAAMFASRRLAVQLLVVFAALAALSVVVLPVDGPGFASVPRGFIATAYGLNGVAFAAVVALAVLNLVKRREAATEALEVAHQRSEALLRNVLPESIASRLKEKPQVIAERFPEATILFADIVGFTVLSTAVSPEALVMMLDEIFTEFDALAERYALEKIKTIGDAYMVVGGLPLPRSDHAHAVCGMALDMLEVIERRRERSGEPLSIRIINTGPVVAGVIGRKKFSYDLWGDAVNTASRMESHGASGAIHVSDATYERLQDAFVFEPRGTVAIKGKGDMRTYWLRGRMGAAAA